MMRKTLDAGRPLYTIAEEIQRTWPKPYFGAKPYLEAMHTLSSVHDKYIFEDGESIVLRFLCNASTWRGPDAKRIKKELNDLLK